MYFLVFFFFKTKGRKNIPGANGFYGISSFVTLLTWATSKKKNFEVLTQHLSSAFVSSVALQISRDALGRNAGDLLQTLQHWSYEEEKPLDLHQFFSFCLVRTAGSWTPSSDLTQNRHLTCEILSTNAHIHMNALKIRQIIQTTFSFLFLFAASVPDSGVWMSHLMRCKMQMYTCPILNPFHSGNNCLVLCLWWNRVCYSSYSIIL